MKIILAEHFGMCFGVRDAIAQAEQIGAKGALTILGELVHNPIVRERLRAQGIREAGLGHALPQSAPRDDYRSRCVRCETRGVTRRWI